MLARASLEVLYDALGPKIHKIDALSQLSAYRKMANWPLQDFVSNAKYWVVYPLARMLHGNDSESLTELPKNPPSSFDPGSRGHLGFGSSLLYTGSLKRLLKSRLVSFTHKNLALAFSLFQGVKRGAEQVPESFIHETMLKHRDALTKEPHYSWFHMAEYEPLFQRFYRGMREARPDLREATQSASYESTRSQGGSREFLRRSLLGLPLEGYPEVGSHLLSMYEYRPGQVKEVRGSLHTPLFSEIMDSVLDRGIAAPVRPGWSFDFTQPPSGSTASQAVRQSVISTLLRDVDFGPDYVPPIPQFPKPLENRVMVSGVLEPLKVRLITKGESWKYWLSRSYQSHLWKDLQRHPQFAATHGPIGPADFLALVDREKRLGLNFPLWVSGDYSAATDNLKIGYTRMAFEASLAASGEMNTEYARILRGVLYEQEIHYPEKEGIPAVQQKSGQLMGSTLSFPILCAVNLVAYWNALERYLGRSIPLNDLPVLVNGDDILFRTDPPFYAMWRENEEEMGFGLSLGKNYVHRRFFTINSQAYIYMTGPDAQHSDSIYKVPMFNVGLLIGQAKVTGRLAPRTRPIWALYNEVMRGAQDKVRAHHRFLHYHREVIDKLTNRGEYNLLIAPTFGGLGFDPYPEVLERGGPSGRPIHFTAFQRRFGGFLKAQAHNSFVGEFKKFPIWRGLVSPVRSKAARRDVFHIGSFVSQDRMRPLGPHQRLAADPSQDLLLPLSIPRVLGSDSEGLRIRRPSHETLTSFRECHPLPVKARRLLRESDWIVENLPDLSPAEDLHSPQSDTSVEDSWGSEILYAQNGGDISSPQ